MTIQCVRCSQVIFRYAPVDEEIPGLCDACAVVLSSAQQATLSCGRSACLMGQIPHECLVAAATGGDMPCPAMPS